MACNRVAGTRRCGKREASGNCTPEDLAVCCKRNRASWIISAASRAADRETRERLYNAAISLIGIYDQRQKRLPGHNYFTEIRRLTSCANYLFIKLNQADSRQASCQ